MLNSFRAASRLRFFMGSEDMVVVVMGRVLRGPVADEAIVARRRLSLEIFSRVKD